MARKVAPSVCRPGSPNDVLDAPQIVFTPSSSLIRRTVSTKSVTARGSAPTGIASASMTMSSGGMPKSPAAETILRAIASRRCGSIGISSSLARAITAAPWCATSGRIASSRSSSPVTEFTSALPSYAARPASSASMTDESMQIGRSVSSCTSGIAWRINSTSSASGSPTFTSSMSAPPATCWATSTSIWERSPACSCAWNALRPVGLTRSPMMQNGCPEPMTTVLDRDRRTVSTGFPFDASRDAEPLAQACDAGVSAEADQVEARHARKRTRVLGELAGDLEALRLGIGCALAPLDQLRRHRDPRHLLVDEAERLGRADETDRRQQRGLVGQPARNGFAHEPLEQLLPEADLELEEACAGLHLLQSAVDAVVERRRAGVFDCTEKEVRGGMNRPAGEVASAGHACGGDEQLCAVEVEDPAGFGLVSRSDVGPG